MKRSSSARKRGFRTPGALALLLFCVIFAFVFGACSHPAGKSTYASVTEEFKTEYYVGESLVVSGDLKIYFDVATFDLIPITADMISGFDTSLPGDVIVKVTYGDFVANVPIHVLPLSASSVKIDEGTLPAVLYQKQPFPDGVTITAVMSDGTTRSKIPVTQQMLGGFNSSILGEQTVTVAYYGASCAFRVVVKADTRVSISLAGEKTTYEVGEQLSVAGAYLNVLYESGNVDRVTFLKSFVTGFDSSLGGEYTATVTFNGLTCDYHYIVIRRAQSFRLTQSSLPSVFEKGDPFPETGVGILTYNDGTREDIGPLGADSFSGFNTGIAGSREAEITVAGCKDTFAYTVLPTIVSATPYLYTAAMPQNASFDGLGGLLVVYEDAADESLALWTENSTKEEVEDEDGVLQRIVTDRLRMEYRTSVAGDIVQKIYFRNYVAEFTVHVYDETERATAVNGISVAGTFPSIRLGDPIDVTGVQVGIDYKYLDYVITDCIPAWVSAVMPESIEGDYIDVPVIISYLGAEAESSVRVLSAEYAAKVTSLNVSGIPVLYSIGDELSLANASAYVVYGGGYASNTVEAQDLEVSGFDSSSAGEKTLTITYGDGICRLTYRVLDEADKTLVTDVTIFGFTPLLFVGDTVENIPLTYGLTLILGYGYDSERLSLSDEGVVLSGGPFVEQGMQEVLLTCRGFEKTLYVMVYPASDKTLVTAIAVTNDVTAGVGTQPDLSQVLLVVEYGHGYRRETLPLGTAGVTVDRAPFNGAQVGLVRTTVTYEGCTCGLFVNFVSGDGGNVLQRLELSAGSKDAFTKGEELSGVELILYYKSGTERLAVTAEMVPDFDTETVGEHTVTISYGGKGVLYTYTVIAAPEQQEETNGEDSEE